MAVPPELPRASTLEELLDLEELDRDLYRAHNPQPPVHRAPLRRPGRGAGPAGGRAHRARRPVPPLAARLLPPVGRGRAPDDHEGQPRPRRPLVLRPPGRRACNAGRRSSPPPASFHVDEESGDYSAVPIGSRTSRPPRRSHDRAASQRRHADGHPRPVTLRHRQTANGACRDACGVEPVSPSPTTGCCTRPRSSTSPT